MSLYVGYIIYSLGDKDVRENLMIFVRVFIMVVILWLKWLLIREFRGFKI